MDPAPQNDFPREDSVVSPLARAARRGEPRGDTSFLPFYGDIRVDAIVEFYKTSRVYNWFTVFFSQVLNFAIFVNSRKLRRTYDYANLPISQ